MSQLRLHTRIWYEETRAKCLRLRTCKTVSDHLARSCLRRCLHSWLNAADPIGMRMAASFDGRRRRRWVLRIWQQALASTMTRKRRRSAALRAEFKRLDSLKSIVMLAWNRLSNIEKGRRSLCVFLERKDRHSRKAEGFFGWRSYQLRERDLLRRVQLESEAAEDKLRADIETCTRMMSRFNWRRYASLF